MDDLNLKISLTDDKLLPAQLENLTIMLEHEIRQDVKDAAILVPGESGTRDAGSFAVEAGILLSLSPLVLTKVLEFVHAWAMRHENKNIRVKLQLNAASSIELDVPQTTSPEEVQKWIDMAKRSVESKPASSKTTHHKKK